ncbi:MAG: ABC transporter permease [Flavobacteriaceae bacterium]|nr:ABC transporter permease [Flavobacteriaceae bacterium]
MFSIERWQEIFDTLSKNKLRTILTGVSVASGIFILVILLGFSSGIENGVRSEFEQDATNKISIWTRRTTKGYKGLNPGRYIQLKNDDYSSISQNYDEHIEYESANYSLWGGQIVYKNESGNFRVQGVLPDYQFIENADIGSGRFINQSDVNEAKKVVVIGNKVKTDLFKGQNPIGKSVSIYGISFKVIGVYFDPGGEREESNVYMPLPTVQNAFHGDDNLRSMTFTVQMSNSFKEAVELSKNLSLTIENNLKEKHIVAPNDEAAIRVWNTLEEAKKIYSLIDTIKAVFWFIGIGTIIAGVVGVGNIMIIIVKERTKEIGIRKAVGARPNSIIGMILQEAIFVTMFSGLFGLIAGLTLLELVGPQVDSPFIKFPQVDFRTALTTVIVLVIAGAFAGFIPAYRAAKIKPIEALRDE